jgi:hypothetical protein
MITTYPHRQLSRPAPGRRRSVSRRVSREGQLLSPPLQVMGAFGLFVLVSCVGWLGWQVQSHHGVLSRERFAQEQLSRTNRELTGQRDRLLARDNIVSRAAGLGLYPARPDQVRKIGGSAAAG